MLQQELHPAWSTLLGLHDLYTYHTMFIYSQHHVCAVYGQQIGFHSAIASDIECFSKHVYESHSESAAIAPTE